MSGKIYKWVSSSKFKGVRYHQHETRKHGVQFDKLFGIRYQVGGKRYENILGWSSEGWTEAKAGLELTKLKEAYKLGEGSVSLSDKRKVAKANREKEIKLQQEEEKKLITLSAFWMKNYTQAQQHKSQKSISTEKGLYENWLAPILKNKPLVQITALDMEKVKQEMMSAGKSPSTINYAYAVFSQIWTMAKRDGFVHEDCPTKKVARPKKDNSRERFLTKEEAEFLLSKLKEISQQTHDMALVALYCGLRFGEIANLEWQCVNFETNSILIKDPKSKKNRIAYFTPTIQTMFQNRYVEQSVHGTKPSGLIFPSIKGDVMKSVSKSYRLLVDELFNKGVTDPRQKVCFHTLRHTFASWLVQKGADLYSVKELMGHADFKMTQRYSHLSPDGLRKVVGILE